MRSMVAAIVFVSMNITAHAQGYCQLGAQQWVNGCEASCTASWEGSSCPQQCTGSPPPGFVILNYRAHPVSVNNGGHSISRISAGQSFNYSSSIKSAYQTAIDAAASEGKSNIAAKLREEMKHSLSLAQQFESSHQLVRIEVNASKHGNIINRKRGWSHYKLEMLMQCVVPEDLEEQLFTKYGLQ